MKRLKEINAEHDRLMDLRNLAFEYQTLKSNRKPVTPFVTALDADDYAVVDIGITQEEYRYIRAYLMANRKMALSETTR